MMQTDSRRSGPTWSAACCAPQPLKDAREQRPRGEIDAAELRGDRGSRRSQAHRAAGGDRPQGGHRRRVPPRLLAFRFPGGTSTASSRSTADYGMQVQGRRRHTKALRVTGKVGFSGPSDARRISGS